MTNGEAVIAKLISEVADLTKANVLLHGIVSNREEEISGIRAQLASAAERVAEMQYEAGMYHSLYDVATERLASARKALEIAQEAFANGAFAGHQVSVVLHEVRSLSLTDDTGQS